VKIVIAGGSGHVGAVLLRRFTDNHEVTLLSRSSRPVTGVRSVQWDGKTTGEWSTVIDGSDVVINLAGRSVNCRYGAKNLREMMDSRVDSTRVIGEAISTAAKPPKVWLQMSTATIYAHRFDAPNDEATGVLGGDEPNAPPKWVASIEIAKAWERTLQEAETPSTRKVAMRSAMVMAVDKDSVFDVLQGLSRHWLGGRIGNGKQFVSWIHEHDFANAVEFLIEREDIEGAVNLSSSNPLPQADFAAIMRRAVGAPFGMPLPAWIWEIGCILMRTESELVLKSRRVIPARMLEAGFKFKFETWEEACQELVARRN